MKLKRGFTLIEVLVVIGIIAVLAGIMTSVYANAKVSAKKTKCLDNLSQIGKSLMMYASDNGGYAPPYQTSESSDRKGHEIPAKPKEWRDSFKAYGATNAIFYCPLDPLAGSTSRHGIDGRSTEFTSYAMTMSSQGQDKYGPNGALILNIDSIKNPDQAYATDFAFRDLTGEYVTEHGNNEASYLYFDGHVKRGPVVVHE